MNNWDEIRAILKEVGKGLKALKESQKERVEWEKERVEREKEIDKRIEKLLKDQEKTDEQIKKTEETIDKLTKKTNEEIERLRETIRETHRELRERFKATDEELSKRFKETDRMIKNIGKEVKNAYREAGGARNDIGRFVEGIMSPSAVKAFKKMKYKIKGVSHCEEIFDDKGRAVTEIDTLIDAEKDGKKILLVGEAKTTMTPRFFWRFINKKLTQIKKYLSKYRDYDIIGFVGSVNYEEEIDATAIEQGIYVFRATDEVARLSVPKNFKSKIW
jgi:DNA repair exonuclease SbcCD ATPase subunit